MGASVGPLFVLALLVIYALLAIPLKSYTQPLIIMSVLPFAFVGAVWGHALLKPFGVVVGFSLTSIFGVVAACGVVVNATLVLIHGVNRLRASGSAMSDALVNAAVSRFRPILITTVTTMAGLTPLMLTQSVQAKSMVADGHLPRFRRAGLVRSGIGPRPRFLAVSARHLARCEARHGQGERVSVSPHAFLGRIAM